MLVKKWCIALAFLTFSNFLKAQLPTKSIEVGLHAGTLIYQGDISNSFVGSTNRLTPAFGLHISKPINNQLAWRVQIFKGTVADDDALYSNPAYKQLRNFSFKTRITDVAAMLVWKPFGEQLDNMYYQKKIIPYAFAGVGFSKVAIARSYANTDPSVFVGKDDLQRDIDQTLPKVLPIIPLGVGVKYKFATNWALHAEGLYRFTDTDYLDGFSYAANPNAKDNYYSATIGISYTFLSNKYKCPSVR